MGTTAATTRIIIALPFVVISILVMLKMAFSINRLSSRSWLALIKFIAVFYVLETSSIILQIAGELYFKYSGILYSAIGLAVLTGSSLIIWRGFPQESAATDLPNLDNFFESQAYIKRILSEHLSVALLSSLPTGEDDSRYGLDFIPFILETIESRRARFERSSRRFLSLTLALGVVFAGIVMYFGYILVNENAAGAPRLLVEVKDQASRIESYSNILLPSMDLNKKAEQLVKGPLEDLRLADVDTSDSAVADQIDRLIEQAVASGDLGKLYQQLKVFEGHSFHGRKGEHFKKNMQSATGALRDYENEKEGALPRLSQAVTELQRLMPRVESSIHSPENRTAEIVKRLALGLVVSTFFLGILRYVAGIYQSHHRQMLLAEDEDFRIRRFYISFKGSRDNMDQRKAVLDAFMATHIEADDKVGNNEAGREAEIGIIKDLIAALTKKL